MLFEGANPQLRDLHEDGPVVYCEEMDEAAETDEEINAEEGWKDEWSHTPLCRCGNSEGVKLAMVCDHCEERVCGEEECLRECWVCQRKLCHLCSVLK